MELERLAALVPPPRSHTVIYNGVLSSHAAWRAEVLPEADPVAAPVSEESPALHPYLVAHRAGASARRAG